MLLETRVNYSSDSGAILPLLGILILTLLSLTALAIDSTFLIASKSQQENLSIHVALSSLKAYNNSGGTLTNKLLAAKNRAESLVNTSFILGSPENTPTANLGEVAITGNESGSSGSLVPGIWHFQPELNSDGTCLGSSPCPCKDSLWAGPCFEEKTMAQIGQDENGLPNTQINSFRVKLDIQESTPIRTFFSNVFGQSGKTYSSKATSSIIPVRALFLLDLSRRSHIQTHKPFELEEKNSSVNAGLTELAAESGFRISNASCPTSNPPPCGFQNPIAAAYGCSKIPDGAAINRNNYTTFYNAGFPLAPPPSTCELVGGINEGLYDIMWNNFCVNGTTSTNWNTNPGPIKLNRGTTLPSNPRLHFKSDYSCMQVRYKDGPEATSPLITENYLVDSYRFAGDANVPPYYGAEPLASMLSGTRAAMQQISSRNIPNEEVGILAFDQSARVQGFNEAVGGNTVFRPRRRFDMTPARADADNAVENNFERLLRLSDVTANRANSITNLQESFFFPRTDASSNLPQALLVALEMMLQNQETRGLSYEAHVVLFTDGLSNCTAAGVCGNDRVNNIQPSIDYVLSTVVPEFSKRNIKLHIFQFANRAVGAHNIMQKSLDDTSSCMQDSEARSRGKTYIDHTDSAPPEGHSDILSAAWAIESTKYFYPSKLYEATKATGGTWAPIKPQCAQTADIATCATPANCTPHELESYINSQCASETANDGIVRNLSAGGMTLTDDNGRLLCSPYSMREQISQYMDDIFKRNPYVIVE